MRGKFIFRDNILDRRPGLEDIIKELPVIASSDAYVEREEDVGGSPLPQQSLTYVIKDFEFEEERGLPVIGMYPSNHPEIGGIGMYDEDPESPFKDELRFVWSCGTSVGLRFRNLIFAFSYHNQQ